MFGIYQFIFVYYHLTLDVEDRKQLFKFVYSEQNKLVLVLWICESSWYLVYEKKYSKDL